MKKLITTLFLIPAILLSQKITKNDITVFDESVLSIINKNAKIEILADTFIVAEGPLWDMSQNRLIFTDVRQNKIFTWDENDGVREYISPSGSTGYAPSFSDGGIGANGLAFDESGNIILCQHGDRRLAFITNLGSKNPKFTTIVDNFEGKRFNSPNDLAISKSGDIYFTDPPYGFKNFSDKYREINFNGVYKYSKDGEVFLISSNMSRPNGIALSLDEKYIYVNNSDPQNDPKILRFKTSNFEEKLFFDGTELSKKYPGGFDGLKVHSSGNIFTTGPNGVLIISPTGKLLAMICLLYTSPSPRD